jgi:hypothetical protein
MLSETIDYIFKLIHIKVYLHTRPQLFTLYSTTENLSDGYGRTACVKLSVIAAVDFYAYRVLRSVGGWARDQPLSTCLSGSFDGPTTRKHWPSRLVSTLQSTMVSRLCLLFSVAHSVVVSVEAWGPLFEPLKGGSRGFSTICRAAARRFDDEEDGDDYLYYRESFERSYHYPSTAIDSQSKWDDWIRGTIQSSRELLWESMDEDMEDVLSDDGVVDEDLLLCGDDCMECAIPEDYKAEAKKTPVDVMSFLGIRRAAPLQVVQHDTEWE